MDKRPNIPKRKSGNSSKLLAFFALVFAFSLPYLLVKNFSHPKRSSYADQTDLYPELSDELLRDIPAEASTEIPHEKPDIKSATKPMQTKQDQQDKPINTSHVKKDNEWQIVNPHSGDSMATIFHRLGLTAQNLNDVIKNNPHAKMLTRIKPNQKLQFLIKKNKLERLIVPVNTIQTLTVYRAGKIYKTKIDSKKTTTQNRYVTATVQGSLYTTAQRFNIPSKLVRQMTTIFNKEIDFSRSLRSGDQFSIIYDAYYIEDKMVGVGDILVVTYTNRGKTYQAIRHTNAHGEQDYFTPQGTSFKKAFTRYPIKFSHISSTFALSRYHPILHYRRAHKGIDLAAPIGTPIHATGDGIITIIDRHNGYGNMIKIKHDKTYSTVYGHLLKFQKGLSKGSRVKRGQVIGYVGQTGLATGPHCHYELHVNNQPRNPTTISLPTAAPVPAREMAAFKAKASTLLARLKLFEQAQLASKGKKKARVG
ncbi:TPA: peptidoglycan DD-metalloendopeptidase family protein [Legionella pneumophila]|uniref:M23 family metallopeptidase n=1 Tax=Legionella pneumophila TaxID=446 RepID=UPI001A33CAF6|nr:peptidoglycan DD-metalloendopeptidase family protein [Legionella pneumophila]HAT8310605.1 peptidoglycan DD-metalloendopeptidase family protein [Legionella pneumophila]HAU0216299.1 peptidoglycan DD-metalloendopeptidase family protein [Legionella pneumophila]HAU1062478.1 peptidoglycan DD-metalloendopeptidase family protein [Legionella pneumophila]HAU1204830.1 peptidoglycan DD-metalloendopeptidase family protein [Legionella pneumophila]